MPKGTRQKSCVGKKPYGNRKEAEDAKFNMWRFGSAGFRLVAYKCQYCEKFHVGHRIGKRGIKG